MPAKKFCAKCKKQKASTEFHKSKYGEQAYCKTCSRQYKADYKKEHGKTYSQLSHLRLRWDVLFYYSNGQMQCSCCGENKYEFLAIDHVDGGGRAQRIQEGYSRLFHYLKKSGYPQGYRVLCHNCNHAIGHFGYCPHTSPDNAIVTRPNDRRNDLNLASRAKVLAAGMQLADEGIRPTLEKLAAITGLSLPSCQRHRRSLKHLGVWQPVIAQLRNRTPGKLYPGVLA